MFLGQAASEPAIRQIQGLVDILSSSPLHAVLILLGVGFLVLGASSKIEWLGFNFHANNASWLFLPGTVLLSLGIFTHPQFPGSPTKQNELKVENLRNEANKFMRREDYEKAIELLRELTKAEPKDAKAWKKLASALAWQKKPDFDQALEVGDNAITFQPDYSGAWYSRALILFYKAKAEGKVRLTEQTQKGSLSMLVCLNEAIRSNKDWDNGLSNNRSLANAWFFKGTLLELLERKQEAREAFDKVLELDPGFKIDNEVRQRNGMPLNSEVTQPSGDEGGTQTNQPTIQDTFNAKAINDKINQGSVLYTSVAGFKVKGEIVGSEIRDWQDPAKSGVKASIKWENDVTSSILFMKKSRVRAFRENEEYGGSWDWKSGDDSILLVSMDDGSQYEVSPSAIDDFVDRSTNPLKEGTLKAEERNAEIDIYTGAGTDFEKLHRGMVGDKVMVISSARDKGNSIWYKIEFSSGAQGWVNQEFIDVEE